MFLIIQNGRRYRYVGFVIESSKKQLNIDKDELIHEIRLQSKQFLEKDYKELGLYLIRFDGKKGIIKCYHTHKDNTIKLLKSINNFEFSRILNSNLKINYY